MQVCRIEYNTIVWYQNVLPGVRDLQDQAEVTKSSSGWSSVTDVSSILSEERFHCEGFHFYCNSVKYTSWTLWTETERSYWTGNCGWSEENQS